MTVSSLNAHTVELRYPALSESSSRKRRTKVNEFLLPEKRKKPVTVVDILPTL